MKVTRQWHLYYFRIMRATEMQVEVRHRHTAYLVLLQKLSSLTVLHVGDCFIFIGGFYITKGQ